MVQKVVDSNHRLARQQLENSVITAVNRYRFKSGNNIETKERGLYLCVSPAVNGYRSESGISGNNTAAKERDLSLEAQQ